ncbi:MAG TPA: CDGSH iron-sulfur domain-containing protein [Patescibacteria group bacterium]|nr:CDGSH iron-sulfur domain-containing protein [Patescibacteria group bacterium]
MTPMSAIIAQTSPIAVELEAGKTYYYCTCGRSAGQPFCDGSHKGTEFTPKAFTADETKTAYLCGCKQSKGEPFCDGSHKAL